MTRWPLTNLASVFRHALAVIGAAVLILGFSVLLPAGPDLPSALAASRGHGKDHNGNGNGEATGAHDNNSSAAKAKKDKKDKSTDENDADDGDTADQANASADQADAASEADQPQPAPPAVAKRAGARPTAAERGGHDFVADEVLVANMGGKVKAAVGRLGFLLLDERRLPSLDFTLTRLRVPRAMTAPTARRLLASRFAGIAVDLNTLYRPQGALALPPPDYPAKLIGWGHVSADCGRGLRMGLLDTTVDATMPALRGADIIQRSFLPADAAATSPEHGSAIAWILVGRHAGRASGLLPGAELAVASVFEADPDGTPTADVVALVSGLEWLAGRKTPIINMSFAGESNAVVALALQRVIAGHAIVVAAAGNGGSTAVPAFPAAEPGVIAVTAVDSHAQSYVDANRGSYVAFAAPGVRVWTPGSTPTGSYHTGTSFAVPFVTAAIAARLAGGEQPDAPRITSSLARTARDLGAPGKDPVFGWGLLQAASPCTGSRPLAERVGAE
jgi:minor extracellular protease Epr